MRPAGFPLAAAIVLAMAALSPAEADMRIGLAAPLTGRYSSGGAETQRGAEAAVADLNAGGGVLGEQIEIITADDYCEDEQAVAAVNKVLAAQTGSSAPRASMTSPSSNSSAVLFS